jgi:hypothetical protein
LTDFSDDETFTFFACGVFSVIAGFRYYLPLFSVTLLAGGLLVRLALALAPPLCLILLLPVLFRLTSHEVKDDHSYVLLFLLAGIVWLAIANITAMLLGISVRDDAIERRNPAAAIANCGAMLGLTCAYAGANVGEGATIWMTFGPAVLATLAWAAAWMVYQLLTGVADAVTLERDLPSALRLAGLLVAIGLILGRAVAGDYESAQRTLEDLAAQAWPVIPLTLAAAIVQWRLRPTPRRSSSRGIRAALILPAIYVAVAICWLVVLDAPRMGGRR